MSGPFGASPWGYNPGGSFYPYSIDQSLRLDGSTAYLTKSDFGTATNTSKRTFSTWIKRGDTEGVAAYNHIIGAGSSSIDGFGFQSGTGKLQWLQGGSVTKEGVRDLRDTSAWYHFFTTWNATDNELFIYVNGELDYSDTGSLSALSKLGNTGHTTYIGKRSNASTYIQGYLAETVFLDGYIGDVNDFGELVNGVWVPKEIDTSSITFGNNGFYLPFSQDVSAGNSISFSGTSDRVQHADATAYDIGASDDFTIEFFFKTSEVGTGNGHFMGNYATSGPHHLITYDFRNASTRNINFYTGNGTTLTWDISGDVTVANNTWHHVVFQRDGTTLRAYIDGTRLTSVTGTSYTKSNGKVTNFNKAYNLAHIRLGNVYTTNPIIGSLSNVRYVIGNTVYADDDNDITVPTATLTAVTGTKLLTAVNSTLGDDISTENNDGTTSGSPTLSYDSPFTTQNFFEDASGNGNDFTANNLAASDVVPDSPTNNWATMNPLDQEQQGSNVNVYEEGNLDVKSQGNTGYGKTRATFAIPTSGKWYWEMRCTNTIGQSMGILNSSADLDNTNHFDAFSEGYSYRNDGKIKNNGTSATYGDSWTNLDNIGVLVDADAGEIFFYKNGTIQNSGTAAFTGLDMTNNFMPIWADRSTSGNGRAIFNFGQDSTFAGAISAGGNSDANGNGDFQYTVPTNALALCSANLPEPTISPNAAEQADDYFNTVLWSGDNTASRAITGIGHAPDFVWIKTRNQGNEHSLFDSVRGVAKDLESNSTATEQTDNQYGYVNSFDSDGFTVVKGSNSNPALVNASGNTYVAWNWKAGGTAVSNTDGSITSQVSAAPDAGFSIVGWTGTGSAITVGHGLGVTPSAIILKNRDGGDNADPDRWYVWHQSFSNTSRGFLWLNDTRAEGASSVIWNDTAPTSSVFSMGSAYSENGSNFIAYCFADVDSYLKCGSYVGNGDADGTFIYTGFRPAWIMMKVAVGGTGNWFILDATRSAFNEADDRLDADNNNAEGTGNSDIDFLSNGIKIRTASTAGINQSGDTHIYLAFAEAPFKFANAR